jgi:hypothetical protein
MSSRFASFVGGSFLCPSGPRSAAAGRAVRVNRSRWHNEAALALDLVDKRWTDLARRLDLDQAGPSDVTYVEDLNRVEARARMVPGQPLNFEGEQLLIQGMLRLLDSLGLPINGVDRTGAHAYLQGLRGSD